MNDSDGEERDSINPFDHHSAGKLSNKKIPNYGEVRGRANTIEPAAATKLRSANDGSVISFNTDEAQNRELDALSTSFKILSSTRDPTCEQ